jgi:hypothetical protein
MRAEPLFFRRFGRDGQRLATTGEGRHDRAGLSEKSVRLSTSTSRRNMVERLFRDVEDLVMTIGESIDKHNGDPTPFVRTAKAPSVLLQKAKRARAVLNDRRSA